MIVIYCPECGNELNNNNNFCSECGNKINIKKEEINQKKSKKWEPCPRCGSSRVNYRGGCMNGLGLSLGCGLISLFIGAVFFPPIAIIGLIYLLISPVSGIFFKLIPDFKCKDCKFTWNRNKNKIKKLKNKKPKNKTQTFINPNKNNNLNFSSVLKVSVVCFIFIAIIFSIAAVNDSNENNVADSPATEQTEEAATENEKENIIYSDKGFAEMGELVDQDTESSILYSLIYGDGDFREVFVEKWNHKLDRTIEQSKEIDDNKIDDNWWSLLELETSDINPRNAPGWDGSGGDIYDVEFDDDVGMTIYNPPFNELNKDNPDLNKFLISVFLEENINKNNSLKNFLSKRRQVVQTIDVLLSTVYGINNYDKDELYNFVSDFKDDSWDIKDINLTFNDADWGKYVEKEHDNYFITLEIGEDKNFNSEFYMSTEFNIE